MKRKTVDVYSALINYGAPVYGTSDSSLSLEEAIIFALKYCGKRGHALVAGTLPYVLVLNENGLEIDKLIRGLKTENQMQLLGYIVDMADQFIESTKFKILMTLLYSEKYKPLNITGEEITELMKQVIKSRHNPTAQIWNIVTIDEVEGHLVRYRKWYK